MATYASQLRNSAESEIRDQVRRACSDVSSDDAVNPMITDAKASSGHLRR